MPIAPARRAIDALQRFAIFNWLTASTDAHAKNIAVLHTRNGPRLAPFYDLASALPYLDHAERRRASLAMRVARHYRIDDIQERHWRTLAGTLGLAPSSAIDALHDLTCCHRRLIKLQWSICMKVNSWAAGNRFCMFTFRCWQFESPEPLSR